MLNKVATQDNLHHRRVVINRQTCAMCEIKDDIINHILFSYSAANYI